MFSETTPTPITTTATATLPGPAGANIGRATAKSHDGATDTINLVFAFPAPNNASFGCVQEIGPIELSESFPVVKEHNA